MIYSDIAGLMDTAGDLIEFVNCFMNKKIFNQAKRIKFIVPITKAQMKEVRGGPIVQQIEIILNLCSRSYSDVIKSIQPVITKVEQNPTKASHTHSGIQTKACHRPPSLLASGDSSHPTSKSHATKIGQTANEDMVIAFMPCPLPGSESRRFIESIGAKSAEHPPRHPLNWARIGGSFWHRPCNLF